MATMHYAEVPSTPFSGPKKSTDLEKEPLFRPGQALDTFFATASPRMSNKASIPDDFKFVTPKGRSRINSDDSTMWTPSTCTPQRDRFDTRSTRAPSSVASSYGAEPFSPWTDLMTSPDHRFPPSFSSHASTFLPSPFEPSWTPVSSEAFMAPLLSPFELPPPCPLQTSLTAPLRHRMPSPFKLPPKDGPEPVASALRREVQPSEMAPFPVVDLATDLACATSAPAPHTPGSTPRGGTPMSTPRRRVRRSFTPPGAPRKAARSKLLRAIERNSMCDLRRALDDDAMAAQEPFWDHNVEPPICAAVRSGCDPEIFEALLAHGADVSALNCEGKTAMQLQTSHRNLHYNHRNSPRKVAAIIELLKGAGASVDEIEDPGLPPAMEDPFGWTLTPMPLMPLFPADLPNDDFFAALDGRW